MGIGGTSKAERRAAVVPQLVTYPVLSATLTEDQHFVRATPNESAIVAITLPPADQVIGQIYDVESIADATYVVQLLDAVGSQVGADMTTTNDFITVMSNGIGWRQLAETTT